VKTNILHSVFLFTLAGYIFFCLSGCASIISKEIRRQVVEELTLSVVAKAPESYKGKTVLWSGVIINSINLKEGTMIEVLQKPPDFRGEPKDVDYSEGRFLILDPRYLDVAIYTRGRKITVAGVVRGKKVRPLGEVEYTYPLISAKEIYLWPVEREERYYPFCPYWYPPWRYYPYGHPRWW